MQVQGAANKLKLFIGGIKVTKHGNGVLLAISILMVVSILMGMFGVNTLGSVEPVAEMEENLQYLSEIEMKTMDELFTLSQKIGEAEREQNSIIKELDGIREEIKALEKSLEERQESYSNQLDILGKILVNYQRRGPVSVFDAIFGAENLSDFLKSLNAIKDISKNTDNLLASIYEEKKQLEAGKSELAGREIILVRKNEELDATVKNMQSLVAEQEEILASLAGQRQEFEKELIYIQSMWDDIKELFSDILAHFAGVFDQSFPIEALNLQLLFPKLKGTIYDDAFNEILKNRPGLPVILFDIHPGEITVELPEKRLTLKGNFIVENDSVLVFRVISASFYGMSLSDNSISELFLNGALMIDFKELMGEILIESVETYDGYLEFVLAPLFK